MTMVAILCSGPSLPHFRAVPRSYDVVVAVNQASLFGPHDWYVAHDRESFDRFPGKPAVGICTHQAILDLYRAGGLPAMRPGLRGIALLDLPQVGWNYRNASMFGAMALAVHLGASDADLFGVDWCGTTSFDGTPQQAGRDPVRWQAEAEQYGRLCAAWSRTRFRRILPGA